jgi:nucleoid-associated protein EbfC
MFKELGGLGSLLKQAREISGRMQEVTDDLRNRRAVGSAGGGMVEIEVNGLVEVLRCRIDPQLFAQGDRELIEDLVAAAVNDAAAKAKALHAEVMRSVTGGLGLPGLDQALGKLLAGEGDPKDSS